MQARLPVERLANAHRPQAVKHAPFLHLATASPPDSRYTSTTQGHQTALPAGANASQQGHRALQQTVSAAAVHTVAGAEQTPRDGCSRRVRSKYCAVDILPAFATPGLPAKRRSYSHVAPTAEVAVRARGVACLATTRQYADQMLNLPADSSSAAGSALVAELSGPQLGHQHCSSIQQQPSEAAPIELTTHVEQQQSEATVRGRRTRLISRQQSKARRAAAAAAAAVKTAATAAATAAAQRVQLLGLGADSTQLTGVTAHSSASIGSSCAYICVVQAATMSYTKSCASILEAACTYDLVRRALYGSQYTVNFPPLVYTEADTEVFQQHIRIKSPGMLEAAAAKVKGIPDYQHIAVRRAADAAVAAAAQRARADAQDIILPPKLRCIRQWTPKSFDTTTSIKTAAGRARVSLFYSTRLEAVCAFDLCQMALGRHTRLHLPRNTYKSGDVAAMQQLLQLDLTRGLRARGHTDLAAAAASGDQLVRADCQSQAISAAAAAAERVTAAGLDQDWRTELTGFFPLGSSPRQYEVTLALGQKRHTMHFTDRLQAACGYDLARRVLRGPNFTVNFPPDMYTDAEDQALREYLEQAAPMVLQAAAAARSNRRLTLTQRSARYDYHQLQVVRAAEAAVEAAANIAAERGFVVDPANRRSYRVRNLRFEALISVKMQSSKQPRQITMRFDTAMKAACAADLLNLVLDRASNLNLPRGLYEDQQAWLDALGEFLLLELSCVRKEHSPVR